MNATDAVVAAITIFVSGDSAGSPLTSSIFYVLGPSLFTLGTVLRRMLPPRQDALNSRPQKIRTWSFEMNRHSAEAASTNASHRRHASAV